MLFLYIRPARIIRTPPALWTRWRFSSHQHLRCFCWRLDLAPARARRTFWILVTAVVLKSYWPARATYPACDGCVNCVFCPKCHLHIPPGYKLHKGLGYYKLHHESKYWMDAKDACAQEGGYLAVVDSK
ncbi:Hemolymph lipopolysaccharide-binding protein, partial [Gryllus bimaculatus]